MSRPAQNPARPSEATIVAASPPRPFVAAMEMVAHCNSRCAYCYSWRVGADSPVLPTETCARLFPDLSSLGVRKLVLTGGEPLLHEELDGILRIAYANRLYASIVTNGIGLSESRLARLVRSGLLALTLSLDTLDPITYRRHRGVAIDAAQAAVDVLTRSAAAGDLAVSLNCVLTSWNLAEVPRLARFAVDRGFSIVVQPCNTDAQAEMARMVPGKAEEEVLRATIEELVEIKRQGAPIVNSESFLRLIPDFWISGQLPPTEACYYGHVNVTIRNNCDVTPCWRLPAVGNLESAAISELWYGPAFADWRRKMAAMQCPGCWLACSFDWATVWHCEEEVAGFWAERDAKDFVPPSASPRGAP